MKKIGRLGRVWALGLGLYCLGCAPLEDGIPTQEDVDLEGHDEALAVDINTVWTKLSIPVCWESPTVISTAHAWVRDQVTKTWEANSRVRFTGWGRCTSSARGIRIREVFDTPSNTGRLLGRELDGVAGGMKLNLTMREPASYAQCANDPLRGLESCVRMTAMHEFGHALGFAHEQRRLDNPDWDCINFMFDGEEPTTRVGAYDKLSVMRTCTLIDNTTVSMSAGDKRGLAAFYGSSSGDTARKDAIKWDSDTLYFFFNDHYTRYSLSQDRMVDLWPAVTAYPARTFGNWPGIPSSFAAGFDAVLKDDRMAYMFRGSRYITYDIAADRMSTGAQAISGAWPGLPSTWTSIDAAIRYDARRVYFFRDDEYVRYDVPASCTDLSRCGSATAPRKIVGNWPGIPWTDIDYVVEGGAEHVYFFKGTQYIKYFKGTPGTDAGEGAVGGVREIVGNWRGVTF
jgi:hypothetical protein